MAGFMVPRAQSWGGKKGESAKRRGECAHLYCQDTGSGAPRWISKPLPPSLPPPHFSLKVALLLLFPPQGGGGHTLEWCVYVHFLVELLSSTLTVI